MKLSLVIPVMNEEENVVILINKIEEALGDISHEIIFVDDGSTDETVNVLKDNQTDKIKIIPLNRNYGQSIAMQAGIDHAEGKYIVTLDGDLQNDPVDIPRMLKKLQEENWDLIAGKRKKRQDNLLRKIPSKIANYLIRKFTGVYISDYGCTLKIFKRKVAKNLGLYGELHRFIPILAKLYGAKITEMDVEHHPRIYGQAKYGIGRTFKVFSDLLLMIFFQKYRHKPMHLFGNCGVALFFIGFFINFYLLVLKLMGESIGDRPLLIVGLLCIFTGVQLITTGFIAEYLMRTYYESQNKKTYNIKDI